MEELKTITMIKRFKKKIMKDIHRCMSVKRLCKEYKILKKINFAMAKTLLQMSKIIFEGMFSLEYASKLLETDEKTLRDWVTFGHLPRIEGMGKLYLPFGLIYKMINTESNGEKRLLRRTRPLTPDEAIEATRKYYEEQDSAKSEHAQD